MRDSEEMYYYSSLFYVDDSLMTYFQRLHIMTLNSESFGSKPVAHQNTDGPMVYIKSQALMISIVTTASNQKILKFWNSWSRLCRTSSL